MLCMTGLAAAFLPGCRKDEEPVVPPSAAEAESEPPRGTMPTLRETGAKPSAAAIDATAAYERLVEEKRAYVEKTGERIGTDDPEKVRAALAGDAQWKQLEDKLNAARAQLEKVRAATKK